MNYPNTDIPTKEQWHKLFVCPSLCTIYVYTVGINLENGPEVSHLAIALFCTIALCEDPFSTVGRQEREDPLIFYQIFKVMQIQRVGKKEQREGAF